MEYELLYKGGYPVENLKESKAKYLDNLFLLLLLFTWVGYRVESFSGRPPLHVSSVLIKLCVWQVFCFSVGVPPEHKTMVHMNLVTSTKYKGLCNSNYCIGLNGLIQTLKDI